MCGRYGITAPADELVEVFDVPAVPDLPLPLPRYNVAPTQLVPAVILGPEGRRMGPMRWGLVPWWAEDPSIGNRLINARSESARSKRAFRDAFQRHRCLVPADGFYEWMRPDSGRGHKRPFWLHRGDGRPFAMAGLWDRWTGEGEAPLITFTILTGPAPSWMRHIHDRAPIILAPDRWDAWMDRGTEADDARELLRGAAVPRLEATEVSTRVNRPQHDDPGCIEPLA